MIHNSAAELGLSQIINLTSISKQTIVCLEIEINVYKIDSYIRQILYL